jgi:hypothetical protein
VGLLLAKPEQGYKQLILLELWKESLNSDGQPFYQYQQNEQPHLTTINFTYKWHMTMKIQV